MQNDDDFEVVPQDNDNDVEMWDADGADEDQLREETILSLSSDCMTASEADDVACRTRTYNC